MLSRVYSPNKGPNTIMDIDVSRDWTPNIDGILSRPMTRGIVRMYNDMFMPTPQPHTTMATCMSVRLCRKPNTEEEKLMKVKCMAVRTNGQKGKQINNSVPTNFMGMFLISSFSRFPFPTL